MHNEARLCMAAQHCACILCQKESNQLSLAHEAHTAHEALCTGPYVGASP